jgi:hypothetical protein
MGRTAVNILPKQLKMQDKDRELVKVMIIAINPQHLNTISNQENV